MQETLSITKALVELKTIDKRLDKKITELDPVILAKGDKLPEKVKSKAEFEKINKANLQSINDLISRRAKIKSAVVQSNAETTIKVAGEKFTVAEAIERKSSIELDKGLRRKLATAYSAKLQEAEIYNETLKSQLLKLLEATYSKPEAQITKEDYDKVAIPFYKNNEAKLINPLNADELQKEIDENIVAFESEVDVSLAESNAITFITIK